MYGQNIDFQIMQIWRMIMSVELSIRHSLHTCKQKKSYNYGGREECFSYRIAKLLVNIFVMFIFNSGGCCYGLTILLLFTVCNPQVFSQSANSSSKNLPIPAARTESCVQIAAAAEPGQCNDRLSVSAAICVCSHSQRLL